MTNSAKTWFSNSWNKFVLKMWHGFVYKSLFNNMNYHKWFIYLFISLFHTPIWKQPEVSPYGRTIEPIKELNEKTILKSSLEMKNLLSRQKQRGVTTSFHHFNTNELYDPCSHKKKQNQNQKNKIKFISVEFSFVSVLFSWNSFKQISNEFLFYFISSLLV